jgi:DNA-binding transcriptional LysR family regulator
MDELARIQTFIKVVEAGSFSAAARHDSSTSSVARQVKSLEDDLGVRLLNRSTRSLSLTEPGRHFYDRVCAIANDLNNAKREAKSFQEGVKGLLRVSLRVSAGAMIIVPALPMLLEQHPDLSIDVSLTDERCDLIASNIDVAVWMGEMPDSDLIARRLSPSKRIACGSPDYFKRYGTPNTPGDLRRHNCMLFTGRAYGNVWGFAKDGVLEEVEVNGNLRTGNGLVLLSAATAGLGVMVVHEWMVRSHLLHGSLVRVLGNYTVRPTPSDAELHAVYPTSRGAARKVSVFVDFLVSLFNSPDVSSDVPAASTPAP